ncbi:hypothetical protein OH77DRAFT_892521 [Trametes cingulata]|nr:hypothetical protein OH77DRAFT_892521 [Trametes cingulata]
MPASSRIPRFIVQVRLPGRLLMLHFFLPILAAVRLLLFPTYLCRICCLRGLVCCDKLSNVSVLPSETNQILLTLTRLRPSQSVVLVDCRMVYYSR